MSAPPWPELQVDRLRELCASKECGSTAWIARQINQEFGTAYTRNAVIGKMGRSEIAVQREPSEVKETKPKKIKRTSRSVFNFAKPDAPVVDDSPAIMPTEFPNKCNLFELTNESCRFPVGDPGTSEFFFCGQPEADLLKRQPYCRAHMWAAYRHQALSTG